MKRYPVTAEGQGVWMGETRLTVVEAKRLMIDLAHAINTVELAAQDQCQQAIAQAVDAKEADELLTEGENRNWLRRVRGE